MFNLLVMLTAGIKRGAGRRIAGNKVPASSQIGLVRRFLLSYT